MSDGTSGAPFTDATHYAKVLRRRWWVVAVLAVIGLVLSALYLAVATRTETATASVTVNAIVSDPFNPTKSASTLLDATTEEQLLRSSAVASGVSDELGGRISARKVRSDLAGAIATGGTVMQIHFTASNAKDARDGVTAAADQYLTYRSMLAQTRLEAITGNVNKRIVTLQKRLSAANLALSVSRSGTDAHSQATSDREAVRGELAVLYGQLSSVTGLDTSGGSMLVKADATPLVASPRTKLVLVTGLLVGLVLGLIAAFVVDALSWTVRDERDIATAGMGRLLGRVRQAKATIPASDKDQDAIRVSCAQMLTTVDRSGTSCAVVLDLTAGAQPSDVPVNLAVAAAHDGVDVTVRLEGYSPEFADLVRSALKTGAESDGKLAGTATADWSAGVMGAVTVEEARSVPMRDSGRSSAPARSAVTDDVLAASSTEGSPRLVLVAISNSAPHGLALTAARESSCVVAVLDGRVARATLARTATELRAVGANPVGAVLVPRRRSLRSTARR